MTIYERRKQLEERKEIAGGIITVALVCSLIAGCWCVASNADKGIDETLATEVDTEVYPVVMEAETEVFVSMADIPIVELGTEEPIEESTEVDTEEVETEEEETEITEVNTTPEKKYSDDDLKRLARLIYFEDSQSKESMKWCGSVVLNRVASKKYPNTIKGVIHQKGQFSVKGYYMTRKVDKKLYAKCEAVAKSLLENGSVAPKEVVGMSHYGTYKKYHKKLYKQFGKVYYYSVK